ncbi:MAG: hypothetical protein AAFP19_09105 [Bacteroidota bacterium]
MNNLLQILEETARELERPPIQYFLMHVTFGMPSANCRNVGICRLEVLRGKNGAIYPKSNENECHNFADCVFALTAGKAVSMIFNKRTLEEAVYEKYLAKENFVLLEDYVFTEVACQRLDIPQMHIAKGHYPITRSSDLIQVDFDI